MHDGLKRKKSKLPEAMEHAICQVTIDFIFHLTGWEERTIFLSLSLGALKQTRAIPY